MEQSLFNILRRANRFVAAICGLAVAGCTVFILLDIVLRQTGGSFGGTDEVAGYVMAAITTWGLSYALLERAHVRIDVLRGVMQTAGKIFLDMVSLLSLAFVAVVLAVQSWHVLERTIQNDARANTPLETPLIIPQALWFGGLVWFALMASLLVLVACLAIVRRETALVEQSIGLQSELEGAE